MIYTSYFAKYKGFKGMSVARGTPSWFNGDQYQELMPTWGLVTGYKNGEITRKEYRRAYIKQLKKLNVENVYEELNGRTLLCYEVPEEFCHRKIIREWFIRNGYECEELEESIEPLNTTSCLWCEYLLQDELCYRSVCKVTGEMIEHPKDHSCDDWRYSV